MLQIASQCIFISKHFRGACPRTPLGMTHENVFMTHESVFMTHEIKAF